MAVRGTIAAALGAAVLTLLGACAIDPDQLALPWLAATEAPAPVPTRAPPRLISLEEAIAAPYRGVNRERDRYRHPLETLQYFGIADDMTVVEIWPGGGWYTEILAPFLRARGHYVAAQYPELPTSTPNQRQTLAAFRQWIASAPALYDGVTLAEIGPPNRWQPVAPGSADLVLTFRNVHNWMASESEQAMFAAFYRMLKPGGVLGVVEHRAPEDRTRLQMIATGYVTQDYVIDLATEAGFIWAGWDEINANPADTRNHPGGVWALPPTLRNGERDRARYLAIGESDRMTLKFIKPDPNAPPSRPSDLD